MKDGKLTFRLPLSEDRKRMEKYVSEHRQRGEMSVSAATGLTEMDYDIRLERIFENMERPDGEWEGRSSISAFPGNVWWGC